MILKNNKRIDGCSDTVPIGTLNPFLGLTAPYGYLICQGQKVSKTTYKELYDICGDTFGQSTDTEFYLPDLRGQTIAGYKEGDSTFGTLGGLVGSLTHLHSTGNHTLTVAEIPGHNHTQSTGYSSLRYKNGSVYMPVAFGNTTGGSAAAFIVNGTATGSASVTEWSLVGSVGGNGAHNHGDTSSTSSIQPTIVLNWIVKAFQLMPNQSYVENSLSSTSKTNALSAAQGKVLNDKINSLSTVANTGSYNDLIDKPGRVDYTSQITCSYGTLNSNFNYCFLKDNMVYLNLSYTLNTALTAGTQYDFCKIPADIRPKGNVIMYAFSHQTSHMIANYVRSTGELVITPEKAVPSGKEINILAVYYIK